jgi:hypothetical protein
MRRVEANLLAQRFSGDMAFSSDRCREFFPTPPKVPE